MRLIEVNQLLSICRISPDEKIPRWVLGADFFNISKSNEELSIVCPSEIVPAGVQGSKHWRALKVDGVLDLSLTGILASLITPLALNKINIFATSSYDTDYVLIPDKHFNLAKDILRQNEFEVLDEHGAITGAQVPLDGGNERTL